MQASANYQTSHLHDASSDNMDRLISSFFFPESPEKSDKFMLPAPAKSRYELPELNSLVGMDKLPIVFSYECKPVLLPPQMSLCIQEMECQNKTQIFECPSFGQDQIKGKFQYGHIFEKLNLSNKSCHLSTVKLSKLPTNLFDQSENCSLQEPTTLKELLTDKVVPRWIQYMQFKNKRRDANPLLKRRADASRKKVLRDLREFYRILFRNRFHLSEYKIPRGVQSCLKTLFRELGMTASEEDLSDYQLFRYLHQTHKGTTAKLVNMKTQHKESSFLAVEKYNDGRYLQFLSYPLSAQMIYFVFENFLEQYTSLVKPKIKDRIINIIKDILGCYHSCKVIGDLAQIKPTLL
ncbi:unnamed protein product [Moneuplotes crassus]|uniref:Uncharacterized protein n=1 Tax=Euplotes crassus TaxID=5936 RepID=A0AAD2DAJ6_EUPCR|nr:unnamed protein product [Moneuplotes crassus]